MLARAWIPVTAALALMTEGMRDGLLGVAWPSIRRDFVRPLDDVGAMLIVFTAAYTLSSSMAGALITRLGATTVSALGCAVAAAAFVGGTLTTSWFIFNALLLCAGLGSGALDSAVNTGASSHPRVLSAIHAGYGVGAIAGPVLLGTILATGSTWRHAYIGVGLSQVVLAVSFASAAIALTRADARPAQAPRARLSLAATLGLRTTWLGLATFFSYSGLELAIGLWLFTMLTESRSVGSGLAAAAVTMFWAGIVLSRAIVAAWASQAATPRILRWSLFGLVASTVLLATNASAVTDMAAVICAGVAAGPVFPLLMAATPGRVPPEHVPNVISLQIAFATVGQALLPSFLGTVARHFGLHTLGFGFVVLAMLATALYAALERTRSSVAVS